MDVLTGMKAALRPLGVYRLEDSLVEKELKSEALGLQAAADGIARLRRELFVATAQEEGLTMRERLCGGEKSGLPLENRRKMLLFRGAVTASGNTRKKVEEALAACGLWCTLVEFPDRLYINCHGVLDGSLTQAAAVAAAKEFLPAHVPWEFDFRPFTWKEIDEKELTFAQMDRAGLSWKQIDEGFE